MSKYPDYVWDQLYFGRVYGAYIGWHTEGMCQFPQMLTTDEVQKRMKDRDIPPYALVALRLLLRQIIHFVRLQPAGERYVLCFDGMSPEIKLYRRPDTADTEPKM